MATPNYSYEKRQRELAKKRKTEEKRQRKLTRPEGGDAAEGTAEGAGVESAPEAAGTGVAPDNNAARAAGDSPEPPRA